MPAFYLYFCILFFFIMWDKIYAFLIRRNFFCLIKFHFVPSKFLIELLINRNVSAAGRLLSQIYVSFLIFYTSLNFNSKSNIFKILYY